MAKKKDMTLIEKVKDAAKVLFLGGFVFGNPLVASVGAVGWGLITIYEIFTGK